MLSVLLIVFAAASAGELTVLSPMASRDGEAQGLPGQRLSMSKAVSGLGTETTGIGSCAPQHCKLETIAWLAAGSILPG